MYLSIPGLQCPVLIYILYSGAAEECTEATSIVDQQKPILCAGLQYV